MWKEPGDAQFGYSVPNLRINTRCATAMQVGPWRGISTSQNGVYLECFVEECARRQRRFAGIPPRA
jgi:isoquinoline 1-oxidoreductase beta subunit